MDIWDWIFSQRRNNNKQRIVSSDISIVYYEIGDWWLEGTVDIYVYGFADVSLIYQIMCSIYIQNIIYIIEDLRL